MIVVELCHLFERRTILRGKVFEDCFLLFRIFEDRLTVCLPHAEFFQTVEEEIIDKSSLIVCIETVQSAAATCAQDIFNDKRRCQ